MAKKFRRECDIYIAGHDLVKAFLQYCHDCDRGCPMGCCRRSDDTLSSMLELDSWKRGSVLQCFADFALSKHSVED